jgi:hypothetical protein
MLVAIKETRESDAAHAAAALDDLLQDIRQRRKEFEAQRFSPDIIQRFKKSGCIAPWWPSALAATRSRRPSSAG